MNDDKIEQVIYLASPYTHPDPLVREVRFLEAVKATAFMIRKLRVHAFGSIVHGHPISSRFNLPVEFDFWSEHCEAMLRRCGELWMLCIPGYSKSKGVQTEKMLALKYGLSVRYLIPFPGRDHYLLTAMEPNEEELYGRVETNASPLP